MSHGGDPTGATALDDLLAALSSVERRRCLFDLLDDSQCPISADWVDSPPDADPLVPLHHVHLARLDELDVVDIDATAGVVRRGPAFDRVRPLLELLRDSRDDLPGDLV